jgi:hypothetical protein
VGGLGDHGAAHLQVPAQHNLCHSLVVLHHNMSKS